jgi:hypothetical protein
MIQGKRFGLSAAQKGDMMWRRWKAGQSLLIAFLIEEKRRTSPTSRTALKLTILGDRIPTSREEDTELLHVRFHLAD